MTPFFSVIIPIYNSEKYLFECINSIIKQQFSNLEIILIDDNSIDRSIKIAELFAKKNSNVKIICNKKNEGVSICRNKGIKVAKGKYIIFVDSDDFLLKDSLRKLANFIQSHDESNIIVFTHYVRKAESKFFKDSMLSPSNSVSKKTSNILEFYTNNFILHTCWSYTYKRSFLLRNKLNFIRHVQNEEDNLFTAKAFCICKKFLFYKKPLYCKRLGAGLLSNQMGYTQCVYLMKVVNEMYLFVKKKKLTNEQKEFMLYRTRDIFIAVIPRLILLNQNEILKLSKIIKSFLKNILIFKVTQERKNMIFFIKKYGPFKGLINYKKFIVNEIKLLIEDFRKKKIYVFSKSFFGISIAQLLLSYDYHVVGFLDNSKVVQGGSFPNKSTIMKFRFLKVFSPIILKGKSKRQLSKFFFIISNQKKPDIQNIRNQLKKYKINKKQIGNIFFRNFA